MTEISRLMKKHGLLQSEYEKRMKQYESMIASTFLINTDVVMKRAAVTAVVIIMLQLKVFQELRILLLSRFFDLEGRKGRKTRKVLDLIASELANVDEMILIKKQQAKTWEIVNVPVGQSDIVTIFTVREAMKDLLSDSDLLAIQGLTDRLESGQENILSDLFNLLQTQR